MLELILIGTALIAITVVIHALGTTTWVRYLIGRHRNDNLATLRSSVVVLVSMAVVIFLLHTVEIILWAVAYLVLIPPPELATFEEAAYFSFVTFTTLGYGDITLSQEWRLLSGMEALNGILLVGWSTAMIFSVMQSIWREIADNNNVRIPGAHHD